jgi:PAS domain S-box-containing protein
MSEEGTATLTIKGDRMLEEIAASKEIVLVEDARTDDRVNKEIVESMGNRTILNIPILLFDRHLGTVGTGTFGDEGVRVPSSSEQKYLIAMASHMAVALDRIHLLAERRKAESELRELNNDFVTLLENTGDFIYFKDQESRIRFCSQTLANVAGHSSWRDMVGKHDLEVFPKDVARVYYEEELPIFRDGKALVNKTDPYYDAQGKPGWVNTNKWPVFGADKKTVVGIFGISRDITELKQAEDKIIELNRDLESKVVERTEQLEAANKELESFSYSVSHDLRSPLRAIDGFSHILQEDYTDKLDDEGKRLLGVVRDNTQKMGRLIDDILAFSRTGRGGLSFAEIDMEGMAHAVVGELLSDTGGLVEIEHIPPARGDRAMMHQVFVNLLSNAIKFSHLKEHAMIKVGASVEDEETIYFVRDNGAGFDMHYAEKLFGVFQRLHAVSEFEGTGIGLAIVKRIVTRHGGRVWAEGKVNEGATFYFALPTPTSIDRETS